VPLRRFDEGRHGRRVHQGGGAAAEEDGAELQAGRAACFIGEVGEERVPPGRLVDGFTDVAVEVAIGAFGDAERPVDVEG
jgi:hypothetical protein